MIFKLLLFVDLEAKEIQGSPDKGALLKTRWRGASCEKRRAYLIHSIRVANLSFFFFLIDVAISI